MRDDSYISDNDKCDIFPRNQHPDTRSDKEYMKMLNQRLGIQTKEYGSKTVSWYPRTNDRYRIPVKCLNNGQRYDTIKQAAESLGLDYRLVGKQVKGKIRTTKGYQFIEVW